MWARVATHTGSSLERLKEVGMQSKWLGRIGFAALLMGVAGGSGPAGETTFVRH